MLQRRGMSETSSDLIGYGLVGALGLGALLVSNGRANVAKAAGRPVASWVGPVELAGLSAGLSAATISGGILALEGWNHTVAR